MRASVAITLAVCSCATLAATGQPSASERLDAVAAELDARESELDARKFWGEPDSAQAESLAKLRLSGWGFCLVDAERCLRYRQRVVSVQRVSDPVVLGGLRIIKKKNWSV